MARGRRLWIAAGAASVITIAAASQAEASAGDAEIGRALFTGAQRTQNGGAPCGACHALGGHGPTLAASLGPDLSHSFEGMPAEAIDGMLEDLPFPTMLPIYTGHPLTPVERSHLAAFLVTGAGAVPPGGNRVAAGAALVAAACLVVMAFASRRRKGSTRAQLEARPPSPERPPLVARATRAAPVDEPARISIVRGGTR